jgi:hypothetical protein
MEHTALKELIRAATAAETLIQTIPVQYSYISNIPAVDNSGKEYFPETIITDQQTTEYFNGFSHVEEFKLHLEKLKDAAVMWIGGELQASRKQGVKMQIIHEAIKEIESALKKFTPVNRDSGESLYRNINEKISIDNLANTDLYSNINPRENITFSTLARDILYMLKLKLGEMLTSNLNQPIEDTNFINKGKVGEFQLCDENRIKKIYERLSQDAGKVYLKIKESHFIDFFSGKENSKITWWGNINELHYMIDFIIGNKIAGVVGGNYWQIVAAMFVLKGNKKIEEKNLKQANKINNNAFTSLFDGLASPLKSKK